MTEFSGNDIIDSRDVQKRIDELYSELEDIHSESGEGDFDEDWIESVRGEYDEAEEYCVLNEFKEDVNSRSWRYGMTFISAEHFPVYAEEWAKDVGYVSSDLPYWIEIDWEASAENLKRDFCCSEFDGTDYYYEG